MIFVVRFQYLKLNKLSNYIIKGSEIIEMKGKIGTRLLFYFGGLIIMTLGVAISVKSD